jgi:hypothetical protein
MKCASQAAINPVRRHPQKTKKARMEIAMTTTGLGALRIIQGKKND